MDTDTETIIRNYDLLPLVEAEAQLTKSGGWYIGPCPFCGGEDRFNLHHTQDGWRWFCRGCGDGRYHDAAAYIMRRDGSNFAEALKVMGGDKVDIRATRKILAEIRTDREDVPSLQWRNRAEQFIEECRQNLWKPGGEKALEYLHGRGFIDLTLHRYKIGYNPTDREYPLADWDLVEGESVRILRGIVLPCIGPGGANYIKIRRPILAGSKDKKYIQVRGGRRGLFGWPDMRGAYIAVFTEGEIDCMTMQQTAGDFASFCTLGSSTDKIESLSQDMLLWLYRAGHVLAVYDNDEAGMKGTMALQKAFAAVKILSLPTEYHDINDAHLAGFDLGAWLVGECVRLGIVEREA